MVSNMCCLSFFNLLDLFPFLGWPGQPTRVGGERVNLLNTEDKIIAILCMIMYACYSLHIFPFILIILAGLYRRRLVDDYLLGADMSREQDMRPLREWLGALKLIRIVERETEAGFPIPCSVLFAVIVLFVLFAVTVIVCQSLNV